MKRQMPLLKRIHAIEGAETGIWIRMGDSGLTLGQAKFSIRTEDNLKL